MSIDPIDPYDRLTVDPPTTGHGGGRCEACGKWCPSLADLVEHYAPTVGITPRTACQTRTLATSGHRTVITAEEAPK